MNDLHSWARHPIAGEFIKRRAHKQPGIIAPWRTNPAARPAFQRRCTSWRGVWEYDSAICAPGSQSQGAL